MDKTVQDCENHDLIPLVPSLNGSDCPGNGTHADIECCCDECDYFLICFPQEDNTAAKPHETAL